MGVFNSKTFNSNVFLKYLETIPRIKQDALINSGVFRTRGDLKARLADQVGGNYITEPIIGRIGGNVLNYDGNTDITATGIDTYTRSMVVCGRAKAWEEKDFSFDITGHDFMADIARQVSEYWDDRAQEDVIAILNGIFGVTTSSFSTNNTYDITKEDDPNIGATTINNAIQQAAGANKNMFKLAIMHSQVATNLENLQLLEYWKYTDMNGVQRSMELASINGKSVLIDDSLVDTSGSDAVYTTYLLGQDAFDYCDCGAKVPTETHRDPLVNGGEETLITRNRKLYAPRGFSFTNTTIISPMPTQLATASNWDLAKNAETTPSYYPTQAIPIARIKSLG